VLIDLAADEHRQGLQRDDAPAAPELFAAGKDERPVDRFGMRAFDRLHRRRYFGGRQVDTFPGCDGDRTGEWPRGGRNRNTDAIEAGYVGDPGDAELPDQRSQALPRLLRGKRAMGSSEVPLWSPRFREVESDAVLPPFARRSRRPDRLNLPENDRTREDKKNKELDLDRMSVWLMNHDLSIGSLFLRAAHVSGTFYADLPLPERGDKSPLKSEIFLICERSLSYRQHWLV
jgi:hypothetical protein